MYKSLVNNRLEFQNFVNTLIFLLAIKHTTREINDKKCTMEDTFNLYVYKVTNVHSK